MSWKDSVSAYGKELEAEIIIGNTTYTAEDIVSINPHYDAELYKSAMKQLDVEFDGKLTLTKGQSMTVRVGARVGSGSYDYISFGTYYIKECEYDVGTNSTKCECYDKMLFAMIPYDLDNIIIFNQLMNKANYTASSTINGITYTNNGDGTITANGTATERSLFLIETVSSALFVQGNSILISGCPANGSSSTYKITAFGQCYDTGNGIIVTPTYTTNYGIYIDIQSGVTVENLVFKPQIYDLTLMFGEHKEPTTVSAFKELFPNDLYDYDTGKDDSGEYEKQYKPMTVIRLLQDICNRLGWTLSTNSFTNSSVAIEEEKFDDTYTFRDVLDQISQVAGGIIAFKSDGNLYVIYPNSTDETIDESNLKSLTVGKKYGPVNSLVLGRSPQEDNIYQQDSASITANGLCEVRFDNNQIMDSHRDDFITALFNRIKGTQYYLYELESYGIGYLDLGDVFTLETIDGTEYSTIMLRDDFQVTQGLTEKSILEYPETTETDYNTADETDRKLNQAILRVNKQDIEIEALLKTTTQIEKDAEDIKDATETLTQELNTKATSEYVNVTIKETLSNTEEVKVQGKDFTFDKNGLTIKNVISDEDDTIVEKLQTQIDEDGMTVSNESEDVLTANHEGVNALNLTARKYLVTGNCRFEPYGSNRTGCFYFESEDE